MVARMSSADLVQRSGCRHLPFTGIGTHQYVYFGTPGGDEGDACTINGAPGRLQRVDTELRCVPDVQLHTDAAARDALARAYADYDREAENAWRKGKRA